MKKTHRTARSFFAVLLALSLLLALAGCAQNAAPPAPDTAPETAQHQADPGPVVDMDAEIVLAAPRHLAPGEADAYYINKVLFVWEPLITQDDNASPMPALAESWEMSADGTQWVFNLRQGVRFHDGEPFNADAVVANFDRMSQGGVRPSRFFPMNMELFYPNLVSYERVDDYSFRLTFSQPLPTLLYLMVDWGSAMFSPEGFNEDGNFNGPVQGTGPFRLVENRLDEYILLERNEDYWGEPARARAIRIRNIPDPDTRFSALRAGEIHGVLDINAIPGPLAVQIQDIDGFALSTTKTTMVRFLVPNGTQFPFDDVRMRQAVSLALDRATIVDELLLGFAEPTTNILNYTTPFYRQFPIDEDMERARELAREVLGDQRVSIDFMIRSDEVATRPIAELIAVWLAEIGVDANIQPLEINIMRDRMREADFGLAIFSQGLSNSEPATIFRRFMLTTGDHNQNYSLGYQSDEVDSLMAQAATSSDLQEIREIYYRIQEISTQDLPVIPLFNDKNVIAYSTQLTGFEARVYGLHLPNVAWAG